MFSGPDPPPQRRTHLLCVSNRAHRYPKTTSLFLSPFFPSSSLNSFSPCLAHFFLHSFCLPSPFLFFLTLYHPFFFSFYLSSFLSLIPYSLFLFLSSFLSRSLSFSVFFLLSSDLSLSFFDLWTINYLLRSQDTRSQRQQACMFDSYPRQMCLRLSVLLPNRRESAMV
jgi:hypothetical protein